MTRSLVVPTPYGDGRLDVYAARGATVTLLLSHGAGIGVEARELVALAAALPGNGATVALFEQPWRVDGR
jgi:predicted alpha/beta-hydrolase family hydrolase